MGGNTTSVFTYTDPDVDYATIDALSDTALIDVARATQIRMRQGEARLVLSAAQYGWNVWYTFSSTPQLCAGVADAADKAASGQVSTKFGVSRTVANRWIGLGSMLSTLPVVRAAFLNGDHSLKRIEMVAHAVSCVDESLRAEVEPIMVAAAAENSADRTLRDQLEEILISLDPEGAVERRKDFGGYNQQVRFSNEVSGHMSVDMCVPAEHGLHLKTTVAQLIAAHVCKHDPRSIGPQRVAAIAIIHRVPGAVLGCECGRTDCGATNGPIHTGDTVPAAAAAAAADGAGSDAGEWDQYFPELPDALSPRNPDTLVTDDGETEETDDVPATAGPATTDPAVSASADVSTPTPADTVIVGAQTSLTVVVDPAGVEVPRLVGFGAIDPAHAVELTSGVIATPVDLPTGTTVEVMPSWIRFASDNPTAQAPPVDPSGHGGLDGLPPKWALTYRPPKWLRDRIMLMDRMCRYPFCGRPSHECDLDHVVRFDHHDPHAGGWTVEFNLAPLCRGDHQRKHMGLLIPTMHADRSITWTDPNTGETLTTFPR